MNKTYVEALQNICLFLYCYMYLLSDHCQKTHHNHIRKISNFFKSIFFNDLHWFSMTFPDKMSFFQTKSNSMTFQGKIEIPWLFQVCMNHDKSNPSQQVNIFGNPHNRQVDTFVYVGAVKQRQILDTVFCHNNTSHVLQNSHSRHLKGKLWVVFCEFDVCCTLL